MVKLAAPVPSAISQEFGNDFQINPPKDNRWYYKDTLGYQGHNGKDYKSPVGTEVRAAADGVIHFEGDGSRHSWMGSVAGICVLIKHSDIFTGYAHLKSTVINQGQTVKAGQLIGYTGQTGAATGPHLHFEVLPHSPNFNNGYAGRLDPNIYLKGGDMETVGIDVARCMAYLAGRDGREGRPNARTGGSDADLIKNHEKVVLSRKYITGWMNSGEMVENIKRLDAAFAAKADLAKAKTEITTLKNQIKVLTAQAGASTGNEAQKKLDAIKSSLDIK